MKEREENKTAENTTPRVKDPHLDTPAEANTQEHINFLDIESPGGGDRGNNRKDKETEERQKQWREGIEEGRKARNDQ